MQIGADKWRHILAGIVLGIVLPVVFTCLYSFTYGYTFLISLVLLVLFSYGFELWSLYTGRGHYDVGDAWATMAGGLPAIGLMLWLLS